MKIKFNETERTIEINDGLKNYNFLIKLLMILNLTNAILNLLNMNQNQLTLIDAVWFVLGLLSVVVLYIFIFKRSSVEKIPIEKIIQLEEKSFLGRKRFALKLHNGRERTLIDVRTQVEFDNLKEFFSKIGILND